MGGDRKLDTLIQTNNKYESDNTVVGTDNECLLTLIEWTTENARQDALYQQNITRFKNMNEVYSKNRDIFNLWE